MILRRLSIGLTMLLAVACGAGSIALMAFAPLGALAVTLPWSEPAMLVWDTGLSLLFFMQHSGMNRRGCRVCLSRWIGPEWHGALYSIASGVALSLVVLLWQNTPVTLVTLHGAARWACWGCAFCAVAVFAWTVAVLRSVDFFGASALHASLQSVPSRPEPFVVAGPYRWVRHPLYSCALVLFWANPDLTADSLLFRALWTVWVVFATWLEERDLLGELGDSYLDYQRDVPMLIPWRRQCPVSALP